jgi:hypothetical protein
VKIAPRATSLTAAGAGVGALASTSGGAGLLMGPVIMSAGLTGVAFVATIAACAVAMHIGRVAGYLASGLLTTSSLPAILAISIGLVGGNLAGLRFRERMPKWLDGKLEMYALVASTVVSVLGLAK